MVALPARPAFRGSLPAFCAWCLHQEHFSALPPKACWLKLTIACAASACEAYCTGMQSLSGGAQARLADVAFTCLDCFFVLHMHSLRLHVNMQHLCLVLTVWKSAPKQVSTGIIAHQGREDAYYLDAGIASLPWNVDVQDNTKLCNTLPEHYVRHLSRQVAYVDLCIDWISLHKPQSTL